MRAKDKCSESTDRDGERRAESNLLVGKDHLGQNFLSSCKIPADVVEEVGLDHMLSIPDAVDSFRESAKSETLPLAAGAQPLSAAPRMVGTVGRHCADCRRVHHLAHFHPTWEMETSDPA